MSRAVAVAVAGLVLLAACSGADDGGEAAPPPSVAAEVASYDLAAEGPQRVMVGLLLGEGGLVVGGEVELDLVHQGSADGSPAQSPPAEVTGISAPYLPLAGSRPVPEGAPRRDERGEAGVYVADGIELPAAGYWEVTVRLELDGRPVEATAAFEVLDEHQVVTPGEEAPRTVNLLPGDPAAPVDAVDSRAAEDGSVPDPILHRTTVADAVATGRPTMVVVSTPVYCVSRFCGPITDTVEQLAGAYRGRAEFVHIEVWRDFDGRVVNRGAAEWIYPDPSVEPAEPWVFLVDGDGRLATRWGNVVGEGELVAALDRLVGG